MGAASSRPLVPVKSVASTVSPCLYHNVGATATTTTTEPCDATWFSDLLEKVQRKFPDISFEEQRHLAEVLGDENKLYDEYFSDCVMNVGEVIEELQALCPEGVFTGNPREMGAAVTRQGRRLQQKPRFSVSLIIMEIQRIRTLGSFKKILYRVGPKIADVPFGVMHSGLRVGTYIIDWNDTSLCIPTQAPQVVVQDLVAQIPTEEADLRSHALLLAQQFETLPDIAQSWNDLIQMEEIQHDVLRDLCKVIVTYNRYHFYDQLRTNCQKFVLAAIKAMTRKTPTFGGELDVFIKTLHSTGSCNMVYKEHTFQQRSVFDDFVRQNWDALQALPADPPGDLVLLRSFHNVFVTRHLAEPTNPAFLPSPDQSPLYLRQ
ncbi:hypothetical protein Pelo_12895 [Pelomyxa schiedti]|nr:hypothetical protein Pelo_12895 [Pelomyxa schiedti]